MVVSAKYIDWNDGGMIVSPTKVGYIIMTSDFGGLRRKFSAKQARTQQAGRCSVQFNATATPAGKDER